MKIHDIKKYLIDTDFNPWRTEVVYERFKEHELDVERFAGIHGQCVGVAPIRTVWDADRLNPFRNNPGKMSITISKMLLFQRILDRGDPEAIIFENDVNLVRYFPKEFETSFNALPDDWEVVHIGHCCTQGRPQTVINDRVTEIAWPLCCHAVLWRRKAIELAYETIRHADWGSNSDIIFEHKVYPQLKCYSFVPELAHQDGTDSEAAKTEYYTDIQGWTSPCMMQIYDEQLTGFGRAKAKIAEVGCFKGRSTVYLASEVKRRLKNVTVYAIDHWEGNADEPDMVPLVEDAKKRGGLYQEFIRNINRCGVADVIVPMKMPSVEAAKQFKDGELAFCYIDAGHSYEDVSADLAAFGPKVHYNSVMAGHDIARPGVKQAVTEYCERNKKKFRTYQESWIIDNMHIPDLK